MVLICARGVMGSKIGGDEEEPSVIREMSCYFVFGLSLSGACVRD